MRRKTIVLTGGGTGGHITPVLAVADELKRLRPDIYIVYVGQKGGALLDIPAGHPAVDAVYGVRAGKFRRYRTLGWKQVLNLRIQASNIRDGFWLLVGIWQSFWLMRKLKPGIIFTRGGYVSVPVALGGRLNGVPYVTHDSDSTPSLANRLIGRWASVHAVGMSPALYPYPKAKTVMVGVPMSREYRHVTTKLQQSYRKETGLERFGRVLLVTGGGNGADALNQIIARNARALLTTYPDLAIVQTAGRSLEAALNQQYDEALEPALRRRVFVRGFLNDIYRYSGAADVIIARAGASTLAELAVQGKPTIVIPASQLVWQEHQAQTLAAQGAIINLSQHEASQNGRLLEVLGDVLEHPSCRTTLSEAFTALAIPDAARRLAMLLLEKMQ